MHIPLDAMPEEIAARFSKCGMLMLDDNDHPKVKVYMYEQSNFNGEALIVYFMERTSASARPLRTVN